jgi:hypothetical protein
MEAASEEVILGWCAKLGLDDNGGRVDAEVIELLDLTPTGPMDAMMVAEAVLSQRSPPSLINTEEPGARGRLLRVDYGLEQEEATGLEISLGIGQGTVLGTKIGKRK